VADFDRYSDVYGEQVTRAIGRLGDPDLYTEIKARVLIEIATDFVGPPADLAILDVGCGPGLTDTFLIPEFGSVVGVDVSRQMVEQARQTNPAARYTVYDGGLLPFESGSFDLVFAICVFHHVEESKRRGLAAELVRVTRPRGLVAVLEHNPLNPLTRRVVSRCEFDEGVELLGLQEAASLLAVAGAKPLARRYIAFFPWRAQLFRYAERGLAWIPLGAQYMVAARSP
jgi:SAM-dependent methyltransferase